NPSRESRFESERAEPALASRIADAIKRLAEIPPDLMIDIDRFKALNDKLGHQAGDDCLKRIAGVIRGVVLRPGDNVTVM
ncbi:diguanylate cyclase, partial [uncultured Enterovirga sp.]|uniref:diguanylate cyclase n=1 Tax=uncultured Enterovirga sp. TaxID=2026352 RepID=UPI0035CA5A4C